MIKKPIKILYLIDKLVPSGTQTQLLELVRHLDRSLFQPQVIALCEGGALLSEFQSAGIEVKVWDIKKAYGPSAWRAVSRIESLIKQDGIDIVQTFFLHADMIGLAAAKKAGVRHRLSARRDEGFWLNKKDLFLTRYASKAASLLIANSKAVKDAVIQKENPNCLIEVLYNGIDAHYFSPNEMLRRHAREELQIAEDEIVVGVVANMRHEVKGHAFLIEAIPEIVKRCPNAKFIFVGDGILRHQYEKRLQALGVRENVLFLGATREIPKLLNAIDIYCSSSLSEGFSNSILEAMAVAKPVIATAVGGNRELIQDQQTGFLVEPKSPRQLAEKIITLILKPELRQGFGESGRARVLQDFTVERMTQRYEEFYTSLHDSSLKSKAEYIPDYDPIVPTWNQPLELLHSSRKLPIRVAYLIWSLDLGGAEQIVLNLAKKLDRHIYEPLVICLNDKGRYAWQLEEQRIKVIALHKKPKLDLFLLMKLVKLIKSERIELIHTHLFSANLWGRLAGKLAGVPVITTEHGIDRWRTPFHFALETLLKPVNQKAVFVSEQVKDFYSRKVDFKDKAYVLHTGIDVDKFQKPTDREATRKALGISYEKKVLGFVGRLVAEKDHANFLRSLVQLVKIHNRSDIVGLIVGDGELKPEIMNQIDRYQLNDHVVLTGFRKDLPELYQAMDVFVHASIQEGLPLTVLEAMASGTPVVATNVSGISECLQDEVDGLLVPVGDPEAIARAVSKVLRDSIFREGIIHHAQERVRKSFSLERMVEGHSALYEETLAS
jgi:glycosyltransferase involved in cell wall biosynthesis